MEQKSIQLIKFVEHLDKSLLQECSISISKNLRYFCVLSKAKRCYLYSIPTGGKNAGNESLIWSSDSEVDGFIFSDDGNQLLVILKSKSLQIYDLENLHSGGKMISEPNVIQLTAMLGKFGIQSNAQSSVLPLTFSQQQIILFVDNKWLVGLKWLNFNQLYVTYTVESASCVAVVLCVEKVCLLTTGGNILSYSTDSGKQHGVLNLHSVLSSSDHSDVLVQYRDVAVSSDGTLMAVMDQENRIFLVDIEQHLKSSLPQDASAKWNSVDSDTMSVSSITSYTSTRTTATIRSQVLGPGSPDPGKGKVPLFKSSWDSYINTLKTPKTVKPKELPIVCVSNPLPGFVVRSLNLTAGGLAVWYTKPGESEGGSYRLHETSTGTCVAEMELSEELIVVAGGFMNLMDAFVSSSGVSLFLGTLSREVLVKKLLVCMETRSLTELLQGDEWGNVLVPLSVLNDSLRQRHIDVIRLALSLHAQAFKTAFMTNPVEDDLPFWQNRIDSSVSTMDKIFNSIHFSIQENIEKTSYSEQLIISTIDHANDLLLLLKETSHGVEAVKKQVLSQVVKLRAYLKRQREMSVEEAEDALSDSSVDKKEEWSRWRSMEDRHVIRLAISQNNLVMVHTYLSNSQGWNSERIKEVIETEFEIWFQQLLLNHDFDTCKQILSNMGRVPLEDLKNICITSLDTELRNTLVEYLLSENYLNDSEVESWKFLLLVEDVIEIKEHDTSAKLTIANIINISSESRLMIVHELFFCTLNRSLETMIKPDIAWKYLIECSQTDLLIKWIQLYFNGDDGMVMQTDQWSNLFQSWEITQDMVDSVSSANCIEGTKEAILDYLSSLGIFSTEERHTPSSIIRRLIHTNSIKKLEEVLELSSANLSLNKFNEILTVYCIKHDLYGLAFPCLTNCEYTDDYVNDICKTKQKDRKGGLHWFKLWLTFLELYNNPLDKSCFLKAITDSSLHLSNGDLNAYLQEHPLVTLAIIIYGKETIASVIDGNVAEGFPVNKLLLQSAALQLPLLDVALSLPESVKSKPDVTVYQLLRDSTIFDVSKLFKWHDNQAEFPHFSLGKLVTRYGHKETLNYLYYLKQGRPCFAVNLFLIEQFKNHEKLAKTEKRQACNFAHGLALQNYNDQSISASCISFIEMLGNNSETLRVHITVSSVILSYLNSQTVEGMKESVNIERVGNLMLGLITSKDETAQELLPLLETAIENTVGDVKDCPDLGSNLFHWSLPVKFAKIHSLKLPEKFLRLCVENDAWLPFIVFIELHKYPVDQVQNLVKSFHSVQLQEHLNHAFGNFALGSRQDEPKGKSYNHLKLRDARKVLYSKIGVTKDGSPTDTSSVTADTLSHMQISSSSSDETCSVKSIGYDVQTTNSGDDIFLTLLNCHRSIDPPRVLLAACETLKNPILAVLATCYEPSSVLACFCLYLLTSLCDKTSSRLIEQLSPALQHQNWSSRHVEALLVETITTGYAATLARAFKIFLPENPLCPFSEFLLQCIVKKDFSASIMNVKLFKASCLNLRCNASVMELMDLDTFLINGYWISSVAVHLVNAALTKCFSSSHHQLLFLHTLCEASFCDHLPLLTPDYEYCSKLLKCLSCTGIQIDLSALCELNSDNHHKELVKCLQQLIVSKQFEEGISFAKTAGLSTEPVVIAQWEYNYQEITQKLSFENEILEFLNKCDVDFKDKKIRPNSAAKFFYDNASQARSVKQRYSMLQFALSWLILNPKSEELVALLNEEEIEIDMWKCWLQMEESKTDPIPVSSKSTLLHCLRSELLIASGALSLDICATLSDEHQTVKLDALIGQMLDAGDIFSACKIEAMFSHKSPDLQILLTCLSLAEGELSPYDLTTDMRMLLSVPRSVLSASHRRRTLQSVRLSNASYGKLPDEQFNYSTSSDLAETSSRDLQDTLSILETLAERFKYGKSVVSRVVLCYRIGLNMNRPYQEIIKLHDPMKLLEVAINEEAVNKFLVASDIMTAAQISTDNIATLLCREIELAINEGHHNIMWGCDLNTSFHLVLELCNDPSLLGSKLLTAATKLTINKREAVKEAVELLIHSHDCYTAACNMEGIASVLICARKLTSNLLQGEQWALMVRLLTGVGRYTEMSYIFQLLKDREQFEFLLGRGMDKVAGLKLAVLEFLKQYCPGDRDLYRMVALHFSLYAEVAILWETEAKSGIHSLLGVTKLDRQPSEECQLTTANDTVQCLNTAMEGFTHAAQHYLQANKLTRAMASARQAELVALQIALVSAASTGHAAHSLLELSSAQVSYLITNKLSFPQAWIVARAYSHPVDWGAALCQRCVFQGNKEYLTDFTETMPLTPSLVEDVVKRFQQEPNITQEMAKQMKRVLLSLNCVEVTYRVASQLGFKDIIDNLLTGPDLAYLKDTVWQCGYSRHQY